MDPKQKNLTPELKQIYERVMNTPTPGGTPANGAPTTSGTPSSPTMPQTPSATTPQPATPTVTTPPLAAGPTSGLGSKPFVYTSKNQAAAAQVAVGGPTSSAPSMNTSVMGEKKSLATPLIIAGVVVLIIVYGIVWFMIIF